MKFDLVRIWKDESYRQGLTQEQLHTLPANPAGELTCGEMEAVCGSGGWVGSLSSAFSSDIERYHSFAFFCEEEHFSWNLNAGHQFLSPVNNVCVEN
ncbi:MAG TPA: mersacidin/lichenicidin family type 2 lantibiotic [Ktedonobacteraceae bacterium]|jgi:mersacidin/lichenicidin family type 2 lantibiotic